MAFSNGNPYTPQGLQQSFGHAAVVVPSDTTVGFGTTGSIAKALYIGTDGCTVALRLTGDSGGSVLFTNLFAGLVLPFAVAQVFATGTTGGASLVALW